MADKIDTSKENVERLSPYAVDGGCDAYGAMQEDSFGDYVAWEDYLALSARVTELEAECWRMQEERDRAIGWRDSDQSRAEAAEQRAATFEAKLAKLVDDLQFLSAESECRCVNHSLAREVAYETGKCPHQKARANLAEIQTETKENDT